MFSNKIIHNIISIASIGTYNYIICYYHTLYFASTILKIRMALTLLNKKKVKEKQK